MKILKKGSYGTDVFDLQGKLNTLGYGKFIKTAYYGDKTALGVQLLQKNNNLPQTGVFDQPEATALANELLSINRKKIYQAALAFLHYDASPNDMATDEYGCADSVCGVLFRAMDNPGILWTVSTAQLYQELFTSKAWTMVDSPLAGDVIISPTGYGNGGLSNGHVGIVGENGLIYSNSSATGTFEQNYNLKTWKDRYVGLGGYPVRFFRKL